MVCSIDRRRKLLVERLAAVSAEYRGMTLRMNDGNGISVSFDDGTWLLFIAGQMIAFSPCEDGLVEEFKEVIPLLWGEYVDGDDCMASSAMRMRETLLKTFTVVKSEG